MFLCLELGITLGELRTRMTDEEILLWDAFYDLRHQDQQKQQRMQRSRRR